MRYAVACLIGAVTALAGPAHTWAQEPGSPEFQAKADALLTDLASSGYRLEDGQAVRRFAPPFSDARSLYLQAAYGQATAGGSGATIFHEVDGKLGRLM